MGDRSCAVKLCGLSRACDINRANAFMPDYIGFVFAKGSKRYVTLDTAQDLRRKLVRGIIPVGVFVNEAPQVVAEIVESGAIDAVQLHGAEDGAYIERLRVMIDVPVWQAFRIRTDSDIKAANSSAADMVLLDSGGGSGKPFDWTLLRGIERPYFLAGGLTPENVDRVIREYRPAGVDASSCLETDGVKDAKKMKAFVEAITNGKLKI